MLLKKVIPEKPGKKLFLSKIDSEITFFRYILSLEQVYIFEIYTKRRIFLYLTWPTFEKKKNSHIYLIT
jgi:hypothetical protein